MSSSSIPFLMAQSVWVPLPMYFTLLTLAFRPSRPLGIGVSPWMTSTASL